MQPRRFSPLSMPSAPPGAPRSSSPNVASGEQRLVREAEAAADPLADAARRAPALRQERHSSRRTGAQLFLTVQVPPVQVVVIGAVHISQALAPMARGLDLDVTIIDPRTAFATPERFPDVPVLAEWPDEALPRLGLDRYTALAGPDPRSEDRRSGARRRAQGRVLLYRRARLARRPMPRRVERLTAAGFGEADIARIHAPIGLDIGAVSPAEIAVAILAEIVATLRRDRRRGP